MRVAYDPQAFVWQPFGGISRYFVRLAEHLVELQGVEPRIFAPIHVNAHLRDASRSVRAGRYIGATTKAAAVAMDLASRAAVPAMVRRFRPSIVHETYYYARRSAAPRAYVALTVYDMIHEIFPALFPGDPTAERKRAACERADLILCISEATRRDLLERYPALEPKTRVTHLGADRSSPDPDGGGGGLDAPRPFILYVGARSLYKNFATLLEAFGSSRLASDHHLVAAGGGPFGAAELASIDRLGIGGRVRQVDADDRRLAQLYGSASLFVYPSLYEGFGLPPLEAMAAGCPVVTGLTSSLPEVCGGAAELTDCSRPDALASAMERVLGSEDRRRDLIAAGRARARALTWERCAAATLAAYRELP